MKLHGSNFVYRDYVRQFVDKNLPLMGRGLGHVIETLYSVHVFTGSQNTTNFSTKRAWSRSRHLILKFGTLSITFEWTNLHSKLCTLIRQAFCPWMKILPLKERPLGHVIDFEILGPLFIFGMVKDRNFAFGVLSTACTSYPMTSYPQKLA